MGTLTGIVLFIFAFVCIILIFLVLIQSGKGGSMSIMGGASQSVFGSSGADVMTKTTRIIALGFVGLAFLLSLLFARKEEKPPVINDPVLESSNTATSTGTASSTGTATGTGTATTGATVPVKTAAPQNTPTPAPAKK